MRLRVSKRYFADKALKISQIEPNFTASTKQRCYQFP